MSPEQVRGEALDARTDIFSFGLVLYEMATGERAFTGETEGILHDEIQHSDPKAVRDLVPEISPKLEATITKCLEKEREQRLQAMWVVSNELTESLDEALPDSARQRTMRRRDGLRSPWRLVALSALLLGGIVSA